MTTPAVTGDDRYRQSSWSLGDLLPDAGDAAVAERLERLEEQVAALESLRPQIESTGDVELLWTALRHYETLLETSSVLAAYGALWFAADTRSEAALTCRNRIQQRLTELHNRILFFVLWWQGLDDADADALLAAAARRQDTPPVHERDRLFFLRDLRRTRPFALDEASEQVINLKDTDGIQAVMTLYSMFTNRFEFDLRPSGEDETQTMSRDQLMSYAYSAVPEDRAAAYQALLRIYEQHATLLAQMYVHRVRDWRNEHVQLRGYSSPLAVRNVANDISDRAVDTLLEVTESQTPMFQRYFGLKAKLLGQEKLRRYDIYAPLAPSAQTISFAGGTELVLETFDDFHPDFGNHARRVYEEHHIDSELRPGKKSGAFCATVLPTMTPWVLVNYTGKLRDVATLAHELGHAVHSMLAEGHSLLTQQPSLPLAETASVFGEMLITDRLLKDRGEPQARRELLAAAIDDIYATVMRQAYFVLFERDAHKAVIDGCTPEDLHEIYSANLERQFGNALDVPSEFRFEWLSIPHIYATPFYCYAYGFGQLLVLALYRRYLQEGDSFKPMYLQLLEAGGSSHPEELLAGAGIDACDPDFWHGGFEVIEELISQFEELE